MNMNGKILLTSGSLAAFLLILSPAEKLIAATIFAQTPTVDVIWCGDIDPTAGCFPNRAAGFSPTTSGTVNLVTWRGAYGFSETPIATDNFLIEFWTSSFGEPGTLIQSFNIGNPASRVDTGIDVTHTGFPPLDVYEHTASLGAGISLVAGTDYWFAIAADTTLDPDDDWFWVGDSNGSNDLLAEGDALGAAANWFLQNDRTQYFVLSTVPIPATFWLFGSALGLLDWMRRKAN